MIREAALAAVLVSLSCPAGVAAIDCSRAKTNAEKMLCSSSRLAAADERLARAYREALNRGVRPEVLLEGQRAWVRDARDACNDVECMLRAYEERTSELENLR
ncbi:MAG TPA: lysozyme inhibitor LprI family protein [Burkholderiales bacterium]|nr:lysozyme inhibitor LprI family protein [Burkholderiales bacterium]